VVYGKVVWRNEVVVDANGSPEGTLSSTTLGMGIRDCINLNVQKNEEGLMSFEIDLLRNRRVIA
jgi:hypothetical protein